MWQEILKALFAVLKVFYSFTHDWGLAIILMTIVFRILVWPLMTKQVKSTVGMQKLQPLMKEIQEKYADDKQKQSEEMMKLYKDQQVSPFAGCLPMLLQLPLLFAFYSMLAIGRLNTKTHVYAGGGPLWNYLGGTVEHAADKAAPFLKAIHLPGASGAGFLPDIMKTPEMVLQAHGGWSNIFGALPSLWPYLLVVLLFAVGSLIPMLMMPGGGSQQKGMGVFMSIFMLVIGFSIPAGAILYYDASTLFAVGQQAFIQKRMREAEEEEIEEIIAAEDEGGGKKKKNKTTQAATGAKSLEAGKSAGKNANTKSLEAGKSAGKGSTANKGKNTKNKNTGSNSGSKK